MSTAPEKLGTIQQVDTNTVSIKIDNEDTLNSLQVNQLILIRSTNSGENIVAIINKIIRKSNELDAEDGSLQVENLIKAHLVGTWHEKIGSRENIFKRSLKVVPSIGADSFLLNGDELNTFMSSISHEGEKGLEIGTYTIQKEVTAHLDGNKFFQRHAVIVGGTGSGKSWTVANILEQAAELNSVNCLVFDLHGEYSPLNELDNCVSLKIAGPSDKDDEDGLISLPYWLLSYEEIEAMILDRSDSNAPNQARALFDQIIEAKRLRLDNTDAEQAAILSNFTIDSPIPYDLNTVIKQIDNLDSEMVAGANGREKQGPLFGKLTRFTQRLKSKQSDKRLNFIFNQSAAMQEMDWFNSLISKLMNFGNGKGCKIIDFSEVPSDILPLITGLVARLIFSIQQWTEQDQRHPIALFCDEAHLYIPQNAKDATELKGLHNFERISKEGRKYGISLVVISQRPSDVNKTVLSQCGNFISMRLTNPDDQNIIKRLFPDSLGGFADLLPVLDVGEALVVGDACLLPSRIKIKEPNKHPNSSTVDFWSEWNKTKGSGTVLTEAISALRKQSK